MQSSKFFNAALYAAAYGFGNTSGAVRYYLNGVYVEPHDLGCTLTATDGKVLISILDRGGHVDKAEIIRLEPHALKACRPGRSEKRYVNFEQGSHVGTVFAVPSRAKLETNAEWEAAQTKHAESKSSFVDGSFPDWRLVVATAHDVPVKTNVTGAIDGSNLAQICAVSSVLASELGDRREKPVIQFFGADPTCPVVFRFSGIPDAFGIVMPCRAEAPLEIPAWVQPKRAAAVAEKKGAPLGVPHAPGSVEAVTEARGETAH